MAAALFWLCSALLCEALTRGSSVCRPVLARRRSLRAHATGQNEAKTRPKVPAVVPAAFLCKAQDSSHRRMLLQHCWNPSCKEGVRHQAEEAERAKPATWRGLWRRRRLHSLCAPFLSAPGWQTTALDHLRARRRADAVCIMLPRPRPEHLETRGKQLGEAKAASEGASSRSLRGRRGRASIALRLKNSGVSCLCLFVPLRGDGHIAPRIFINFDLQQSPMEQSCVRDTAT